MSRRTRLKQCQILSGRVFQILWPSQNIRTLSSITFFGIFDSFSESFWFFLRRSSKISSSVCKSEKQGIHLEESAFSLLKHSNVNSSIIKKLEMAKNTHLKRQIVLQFDMEKIFGLGHPMAMFVYQFQQCWGEINSKNVPILDGEKITFPNGIFFAISTFAIIRNYLGANFTRRL